MDVVLLFISFAVILAGALLFTNAVEWIGHRLGLGEGAVGSLLAAVGTAMPETLIAIVALLDATAGAEQVAIGAIVGAPFLLATLAMGLVGLFAYLYRDRREQGIELRAHRPTLERDLIFFLGFFVLVLAGRRDFQRRLDYGFGFFFLFGLGALVFVFVLVFFVLVIAFGGLDRAGGNHGLYDTAAALLEQRFGLIAETALGALDRPLREVVKPRGATGARPFGSKICLDQDDLPVKKGLLEGRVCHG